MGGTKLLAGAVDSGLSVHHRAQRNITRLDVSYLLDVVVDAVEETVAGAGGEVAAVGFGIPSLIDQRTGNAVIAVNLPLTNVMFADVMAERLDLPVFVDNDANVAVLAEHRAGAARGCNEVVLLTLGTGIGGGLILRGRAVPRGGRGGRRARAHGDRPRRPAVPGQLPQPRLRRGAGVRHRARARGAAGWPASDPIPASAGRSPKAASSPARSSPSSPTTATRRRSRRSRRSARDLGVAIASFVNIFNPEVVVIGGGVIGAGELLLGPVRAEVAARALPPSRDLVEIVAGCVRGRGRDDRRRGARVRRPRGKRAEAG